MNTEMTNAVDVINETEVSATATTKKNKETQIVFKCYIARGLLKRKHEIVDIKPMRGDTNRTCFVFKIDDTLYEDMQKIVDRHEEAKKANKEKAEAEDKGEE